MEVRLDIVDLVLTICLLATPTACREERLHFESSGSLQKCMFLAPTQIVKWSEEHPAMRVARWKCAYPSKELSL